MYFQLKEEFFFFFKILNPVNINVIGNKYAMRPTDCNIKSDIQLPWNPKIFLISVFSGKIKFGSSGE